MIDNKSTNHNMETMSKQELIKKLKADSLPVIIYGAGATGQVLYHACIESGIEVECFCDGTNWFFNAVSSAAGGITLA